jgi:hypothetical protein
VRSLGGLRVRAAGSPAPNLYTVLEPQPVDVTTGFLWFTPSSVAFLRSVGAASPFGTTAALVTNGFSTPRDLELGYPAATRLERAHDGFFAIPSGRAIINFYPNDESLETMHYDVLVAPSGRYTARAENAELKVFRARDDSLDGSAYTSLPGCEKLLAWADGRDRLACVSSGSIQVFDVDPNTDSVTGPFGFSGGAHPPAPPVWPRLFSRSGERFAFATTSAVYLADAGATGWSVIHDRDAGAESGQNVVLAFSPDARLLIEHRGNDLYLIGEDNAGYTEWWVYDQMTAPAGCSENFDEPPGSFCGERRERADFAWSSDSGWVAAHTAERGLTVYDVRRSTQSTFHHRRATDACSGDCTAVDQFVFQP